MRYLLSLMLMLGMASVSFGHDGIIHTTHENIPDYVVAPDTVTVKSGNWFDPSVWSNGVPTAAMDAEIMSGHSVDIDSLVYDADFDNDGNVNTIDYLMVKNNHPDADMTNDGVVDDTDFHLFTDVYFGIVSSIPPQDAVVDDLKISEGGKLVFGTDVNTKLTVTTLEVFGELEQGTSSNPVLANSQVIFRDKPIDTQFDPQQFGHGLLVLNNGKVSIHGKPKMTYAEVDLRPVIGDTVLSFKENVDWNVGDELYIPETIQYGRNTGVGFAQAERVFVVGVDGKQVTINRPLVYNHTAFNDVPLYIANLTNNVVYTSENPDGVRGHGIFHGHVGVKIKYVVFDKMGRTTKEQLDNTHLGPNREIKWIGTNQIGRYPLHFHHCYGQHVDCQCDNPETCTCEDCNCQDPLFETEGCVVKDGRRWGIAIHGSHYGLVKKNVIVNVESAGIIYEDGSETLNDVIGNYIAYIKGSGLGVQGRGSGNGGGEIVLVGDGTPTNPYRTDGDHGHEGAGIWGRGAQSNTIGNIIYNCRTGYTLWSRFQPDEKVPLYKGADVLTQYKVVPAGSQQDGISKDNQIVSCQLSAFHAGMSNVVSHMVIRGSYVGVDTSYSVNLVLSGNFEALGGGATCIQTGFSKLVLKDLNVKATQGINAYEAINMTNCYFDCVKADIVLTYGQSTAYTAVFDNIRFSNNDKNIVTGDDTKYNDRDYTRPAYFIVKNYNGVQGDDFELFFNMQEPQLVWKAYGVNGITNTSRMSPEYGLTNQQLWDKYKLSNMGRPVPATAVRRQGIEGWCMPIRDMEKPVISDVVVTTSVDGAVVKWKTDKPTYSQLQYRNAALGFIPLTNYDNFLPASTELKTEHEVVLTGLASKTKYYYILRNVDEFGNLGHLSLNTSVAKFKSAPTFTTK